jgi:hypothetical protein
MATALNVKNAAKTTVLGLLKKVLLALNVTRKAEIITNKLVIDPSTKLATTSMIDSFFRIKLSHSLLAAALRALTTQYLLY